MAYFKVNKKKSWEQKVCTKLRNKRKNFKSVKGLQRNFRKCILSFCRYLEIKAETKKNAQGKSWFPKGPISPLKIFTL